MIFFYIRQSLFYLAVFSLLAACSPASESRGRPDHSLFAGKTDDSPPVHVQFPFSLSHHRRIDGYEVRSNPAKPATDGGALTGELRLEHIPSGHIETFPWATLGRGKTIVLFPGDYRLELSLGDALSRYVAVLEHVEITEGTRTIPLSLRPVFGATAVGTKLRNLTRLRFEYDPPFLSTLKEASLGVVLDDLHEFYLPFDSGMTDGYLDLSEGPHTIRLRLYESGRKIAASLPLQESVFIVPGRDLRMDLAPPHGETTVRVEGATSSLPEGRLFTENLETGAREAFNWPAMKAGEVRTLTYLLHPGPHNFTWHSGDHFAVFRSHDVHEGENVLRLTPSTPVDRVELRAEGDASLLELSFPDPPAGDLRLAIDGGREIRIHSNDKFPLLSAGLHRLEFRLYRNGALAGLSVPVQERIDIRPGEKFAFDLLPPLPGESVKE